MKATTRDGRPIDPAKDIVAVINGKPATLNDAIENGAEWLQKISIVEGINDILTEMAGGDRMYVLSPVTMGLGLRSCIAIGDYDDLLSRTENLLYSIAGCLGVVANAYKDLKTENETLRFALDKLQEGK